jgi:dethiobiotin synthetase
MKHVTFFITGNDTGVGKTVLAVLLTRHLRARGIKVAALKPLCSGDQSDALLLRQAAGDTLPLQETNPWHFRAALAPLVAARRERRQVTRAAVLGHVRRVRRGFDVTLIEGAGGLLSPLGGDFTARELIVSLQATPLVVCPNRLGAINQALLVLAALPAGAGGRAQVVLISQRQPDGAERSNVGALREALGSRRVHVLPWLSKAQLASQAPLSPRVGKTLDALVVL